ncbi:ABC transporter ATP-binding protein [Propylenella binzhouense]|uniref:ABC transporter ATP-binding protein n=1 Tax=Propylenella binzhouense TaxID=2555902 RepID=A0A964T105_9HYPH|nr:ABC transporter ATP-binding protein [Propylenella binzhouense]MYZ46239.1 ABC transporter ATP-binding protein [Propylenella binzhouense]
MTFTTLELRSITVRFDGVVALKDVSFVLESGRIFGLIGPNGAGKTTLVNVISGFQKPSEGEILLDGAVISDRAAHTIARLGVARTFQAVRLFRDFTVHANLHAYGVGCGLSSRAARERADAILAWLGLSHMAEWRADGLSYGDERRIGIGRALAAGPKFILLDEPAAGMNEEECDELMRLIRDIPGRFGCSVLLIEHNMRVVMNVCDRIAVIDFGRKIAEGTPAAVSADPAVRAAYLGEEVA